QLMLNSWFDVYDEFPGIPYQSLFEFIDEVTPEVAKQLEADWLAFERFKDEAPMEVRSEISPPHSEIINDQISLTYYLLSRDYDVIKCIIIYRDKQFELSAVDSLGNYIEGYGD
ncbi:MAG: hypothetical protein ACE5GA_08865, partial [Candidatus Zixiibacteriota bacterium]